MQFNHLSTKLLWLNWLLLCKFHITPQHWNCTSISNSPQRKTRISWPYHYVVNIMHADDWQCKDQHELWTGLNCHCFHRIILALHNKGFNFHFTSMLWFPYIFSCVAIYIYTAILLECYVWDFISNDPLVSSHHPEAVATCKEGNASKTHPQTQISQELACP